MHALGLDPYLETAHPDYDIALLIMEVPFCEQAGYMEVACQPASFFADRELHLGGYPADIGPLGWQYHGVGRSRDVEGLIIRHEIDAGDGQSGGPLWYEEESGATRRLVGIHTGARDILDEHDAPLDSYNAATHINASIYNWMRETLLAYDSVVLPEAACADSPLGLVCPAAAVALFACWGLCAIADRHRRRRG